MSGLYEKYVVYKTSDGMPVDYPCFVLRIDGHDKAAIKALEAYALAAQNLNLKDDLADRLSDLNG